MADLKFPRVIATGHMAKMGKGEIASYLAATHGYQILRFAERLREVAVLATGLPMRRFNEDKTQPNPEWGNKTGAQILQDIGSGMRNALDKDVWAKVVAGFIRRSSDTVRWCVEDLRYPNEVTALRAVVGYPDVQFWKVMRPEEQRGDIGRPRGHESETALATYDSWDECLVNDGTIADLQGRVETALSAWRVAQR